MRLLLVLTGLLFQTQLFAVCMTELDGELYGCMSMQDNKSAVRWCKKKYGQDYLPFYTTNNCSKALAAQLRGESYTPSEKDKSATVKAACMSFEQGTKRGCTFYDYHKAERYCVENFGHRYVPFIIDGKNCSEEVAKKLRGEVDDKKLIEGLDSDIDELEKMMTMLDREGINSSLGSFISARPNIGIEFYTGMTKRIMAQMNTVKKRLYENSHLNIPTLNRYTKKFLKYNFRYLSLLGRLYKLYAHVAHKNQYVLKTYDFKNFEYLNLKLKKEYALEIIAKVNYTVATIEEGRSLEFKVGEQEKQTYEYQAIQDPQTKVEYSKLISFLGIRESLTNLWAVQRLTPNHISNNPVASCGKSILSFRPGRRGVMAASDAMQDLFTYDVFYNDYISRWKDLVIQSQRANILDEDKASALMFDVIYNIPEVRTFLKSQNQIQLHTMKDFKRLAQQDAKMLVLAEQSSWESFSNDHFTTIVMPGDGVLDTEKVIRRIFNDSYKRRVDAIVDAFLGSYVWLSDSTLEKMESKIRTLIETQFRKSFFDRTRAYLLVALSDYNDREEFSRKNRSDKINSTLADAYLGAHAVLISEEMKSKNPNLENITSIKPLDMEELVSFFNMKVDKDFFDVRYTMEQDKHKAKIVDDFFESIAKEFFLTNKDLLEQISKKEKLGAVKSLMFENNELIASKLRDAAIKVAREHYLNYPYEVNNYMLQESPQSYVWQQSDMSYYDASYNNEGHLPLYEDGTPVVMTEEELTQTFDCSDTEWCQSKYESEIPLASGIAPTFNDMVVAMGYFEEKEREDPRYGYNRDKLSTGDISRPLRVNDKGEIVTPRGVESIENNALIDMYLRSGLVNKEGAKKLKEKKEKIIEYNNQSGKASYISDDREFFYRVLDALNLEWVAYIRDDECHYRGEFTEKNEEQLIIANLRLAKAYQAAPILKNEVTWTERVKVLQHVGHWRRGRLDYTWDTKSYRLPLLIKIAKSAFNRKTLEMNINLTARYINKVLEDGIRNASGKLSKFCMANYLNYKNDEHFKDVYKASRFLRSTIQNPVGITEKQAKRYQKFDQEVTKDIRGRWEAWNEDYFEPSLKILGTAALISLAVVMIIGTGGAAAPGVIGGVYAAASTFLTIEFFVSFPLVAGSLYARFNTHFIEVPTQLKFQRSLAISQLDQSQIVDWDMLRSDEKQNSVTQAWTLGLAPLDFIYGYSLVRHVRAKVGIEAVHAFRRQTGMQLRKWSAPPKSMLVNRNFKELRQRHGLWKAALMKGKDTFRNAQMYLPKYQPISEEMIRVVPLRMGLTRKAAELGIHNKPWALLDELSTYTQNLKSRYKVYQRYVQEEARFMQHYRLNGRFKFSDIRAHGLKYSAFSFIPKSFVKAVKEKRLVEYLKNFGEVWDEIKFIQGELINGRVTQLQSVLNKLEDFKRAHTAGKYPLVNGKNLMEDFQKLLTNEEIMILEEVAKKSKGQFKEFKNVFKDFHAIQENLRPSHYLYGNAGAELGARLHYPQNIIMGDVPSSKYAFDNETEDIVNFYESMMRQNGDLSDDMAQLRRSVEERLSKHFIYNARGERIYID